MLPPLAADILGLDIVEIEVVVGEMPSAHDHHLNRFSALGVTRPAPQEYAQTNHKARHRFPFNLRRPEYAGVVAGKC
jgi:hypothetical protein